MDSKAGERADYYKSLKRNIFIAVVIVSFIPLLIFGGIIRYVFQTSYTDRVRAHLATMVKKHALEIDTFLTERQANIVSLACAYTYEQYADNTFLKEVLGRIQNAYGAVITDLGIINENGEQISYAGPFQLEDANYSDSEWFRHAISSDIYTSDVFMGLRGQPHFIVAVRSYENGNPWLFRATIDFRAFNDLVQSIHMGETGFAFIINREGEMQTDFSPRMEADVNRYSKIFTQTITDSPALLSDEPLFDSFESGTEKEIIYVAGLLKKGEWALIFQQDHRDAYSNLYQARRVALLTLVLGGISIILMAFWVSRHTAIRIAEADKEKEIMNRQVIQSGHLASIGMLAAGIAHEINNPVAIMVEEAGWIEDLLEDEEFQESENLAEFTRALGQIRKQGLRCRDITHKLLSFARRSDQRIQFFNINDLIREIAELIAQHAKYNNVTITLKLNENLPHIEASQTEVEQVLFNLINNAIDAIDKKGGHIRIRTWQEGGMIRFDIQDTGSGIPGADLERIFDPFFTTKPVGIGTGLGLSICYGIVKKMGGDIIVESTVGKGSRFEICLPGPEPEDDTQTQTEHHGKE
ncbi:MAG: ATP-binding protein [Desulfococcaceae bacterium]|jgi:two-component system NtrC family sensor kinase|nr:ATP-binding protein [Desulfococcaceae bacterium]